MNANLIEKDAEQRTLALNPALSFIVQAPAGSGKTELLIQRFLTLLNHVNKPEEILAITFTKKAANEMRLRVLKALRAAKYQPQPSSSHASKTWQLAQNVLIRDTQFDWKILENPNQLRIQTIDSLCSYLTKQLPLLSNLGSQPKIAVNASSLYREAVYEILTHLEKDYEWSHEIANLLMHLDNDLNKLHDLLVVLLAKRDQWLPYIHLNVNAPIIKKQLEQHLKLVISDHLQNLHAMIPEDIIAELLAILRFAAANSILCGSESEIIHCENLTTLPGITANDKSTWIGLAKLLLTKSHSYRKRVDEDCGFPSLKNIKNKSELNLHQEYRQRFSVLMETISADETLRLALKELHYLPHDHYENEQWDVLQSLLLVLKVVTAQLRVTFQTQGKIDFIENTQAALTALGDDEHPTDLALALDYQIKHILIDEFQDTSYTQYQLLEKLIAGWQPNDGRTLFVVGDPMQSIYRFREADVGLFIRMCSQGIANLPLIPLTLAVNFRSDSSIIEWNNLQFKSIFPLSNDIATGAVSFNESATFTSTSANTSHISIKGFVDADEQTEAQAIIELIKVTKEKYPTETIAILVRSRSHLTNLIPALKTAKITYRAIDIDALASRQHIQDLLSLTRALIYPADRIAWLSVLRAPWCGLSLADLLHISGGDANAIIMDQLEKCHELTNLSPEGLIAIQRIYPIIKSKIDNRDREHLRTWIESTWLLLGGPAYLNDESEIDDANAFFNLLDKIYSENTIFTLEKLYENLKQLFASSHHDESSIQIMTIHTAKGLEFDTVILPQLNKKNPNDDKSLLLWMERPLVNDQMALLLAPIHATGNEKDLTYEYIHRQQKIKSEHETDRLFYVATTRAKKRLHLFFNTKSNKNQPIRIETNSFLEKLWPNIEKHSEAILEFTNSNNDELTNTNTIKRYIKKFNLDWQNPIRNISTKKSALHQKNDGFQLGNNTNKIIGIVTHKLLQEISQAGVTWWLNKSEPEKISLLNIQLKQSGLQAAYIENAVNLILKSIQNTLNDKRGLWILKSHKEAKSEFALTAMIDNKLENLIIDRTFIDENGMRWIIDYKTTNTTEDEVTTFLENEKQKYNLKMQKYQNAFKISEQNPIRLGLYFPALPAWYEWE